MVNLDICVVLAVMNLSLFIELMTRGYSVPKIEKIIIIKNKLGIHARPAALLVQTASKYSANIDLETNGIKVNGKSIMGVMMLAAGFESELKIIADGDDADAAIEGIEALIDSKFDEE